MELLRPQSAQHRNWIRLYDADNAYGISHFEREIITIAPPLDYVSLLGLTEPARWLIEEGAEINTRGEQCSTALQAASVQDNTEVVQIHLAREADVQGEHYNSALQAASEWGYVNIVKMLLGQWSGGNSATTR